MAGYLVPGNVREGSQLHYALQVLWHLTFARSDDIEEARRNAWTAGVYAQEAMLKFAWEKHAMRGRQNLQSVSAAAKARAQKARARSRAPGGSLLSSSGGVECRRKQSID